MAYGWVLADPGKADRILAVFQSPVLLPAWWNENQGNSTAQSHGCWNDAGGAGRIIKGGQYGWRPRRRAPGGRADARAHRRLCGRGRAPGPAGLRHGERQRVLDPGGCELHGEPRARPQYGADRRRVLQGRRFLVVEPVQHTGGQLPLAAAGLPRRVAGPDYTHDQGAAVTSPADDRSDGRRVLGGSRSRRREPQLGTAVPQACPDFARVSFFFLSGGANVWMKQKKKTRREGGHNSAGARVFLTFGELETIIP